MSRPCQLADIRYEVEVYASSPVDEDGGPDRDRIAMSISDNSGDWIAAEQPYYCDGCGQPFENWDDAKAHLEAQK